MPQKSLFDYTTPAPKKPVEQAQSAQRIASAEAPPVTEPEKKKQERRASFKAPENLPESYFVSATYDGRQRKAVVKLYEPKSGNIYFWYDNTGHKPYCLTNLSEADLNQLDRVVNHEGFDHTESIELFDPLLDHNVTLTKIVTNDPLAIGGKPSGTIRDIIPEDFPKDAPMKPEVWEAKIKYYQSYIYDTRYLPGMIYEVKEGSLKSVAVEQAEQTIAT
jgi:DNA polymerase I